MDRAAKKTKAVLRAERIIQLAKERFEKDGELEFDDEPKMSESDDNGAYVQAWVWIDFTSTELDKENGGKQRRTSLL